MQSVTLEEVFAQGLHEELTGIIGSIAGVCDGVSADYFHPAIDALAAGGS
jgi:hypothetical protein